MSAIFQNAQNRSMKRQRIFLLGLLISWMGLFSACDSRPVCQPASFADPNLEQFVRVALGNLDGEITTCDLETLEEVSSADFVPIPEASQIKDLSGIEQLSNLKKISFSFNDIEDLSPLAKLTDLEQLHLSQNRIADIGPLASLKKMKRLFLSANRIEDISPLAQLRDLEWLLLIENQIADISPLEGLQKLTLLRLNNNLIESVDPLANLPGLNELNLSHNLIQGIGPLVKENHWKTTFQLDLSDNPLSNQAINEDVAQLVQMGVQVNH